MTNSYPAGEVADLPGAAVARHLEPVVQPEGLLHHRIEDGDPRLAVHHGGQHQVGDLHLPALHGDRVRLQVLDVSSVCL